MGNIHERVLNSEDVGRAERYQAFIGARVIQEIQERLRFLDDVGGVGYLNLARGRDAVRRGEARIRLATRSVGPRRVLYILDEPSIGLHQRDNPQLIATLDPPA